MKKAISIFLAVVMVLALVACGNSAAPNAPAATNNGSETAGTDSDTIKIGYVSDLTGATALWGTAGQYGAELAVKDINEAGLPIRHQRSQDLCRPHGRQGRSG